MLLVGISLFVVINRSHLKKRLFHVNSDIRIVFCWHRVIHSKLLFLDVINFAFLSATYFIKLS